MNYIAWKGRMAETLEENGLNKFIDHEIPKPPTSNAKDLDEWRKWGRSEKHYLGGSLRPYCLEYPCQGYSILNVEGIDGPVVK